MRALVLVGGQGTRLRPLTYSIPKPMLPIVEEPMIGRVVEWLADFGIDEVIFSLGYQPSAFVESFANDEHAGVRLRYAVEPEPLDTAGAIAFAAAAQGATDERLIVVNGDVLTDLDLSELLAFHAARQAAATIALTPVEDPSAFGVVPTDEDGRVRAFIEKPPRERAPTNLINAGTYVLEPAVIAAIPKGRRVSIERETFPELVKDGTLYAMASDAYWLDTGTPENYLSAQFDVLGQRRRYAGIPTATEVAPTVYAAPGAKHQGSIRGLVFLGQDSVVEVGAIVLNAVIGAGCVVRADATVISSVLLPGSRLEEGASVHTSLVGPRAVLGRDCEVRGLSIIGADQVIGEGVELEGARVPEEQDEA